MPMGWLGRKLDSLTGATVGAAGAIAASQWREYLQQYRQRLGGHLDEASGQLRHLTDVHAVADTAQRPVVAEMMAASEARTQSLAEALRALAEAPTALQPWAFVRHLDPVAARATLEAFQPALPLDAASLAWAGVGLVAALVLYEALKGLLWTPVALARRARRPRAIPKRRAADRDDGRPGPRERREPRLES